MKYLLIMNPGSKAGRNKWLWKVWGNLLKQNNVDFEITTTDSMEHASNIAQTAKGFDTIVAVGGDGTINRVIHGVIESSIPGNKVGVLYSGTSPDFCRFHNIPLEPVKAMETLLSGKTRYVDIAKITYQNYRLVTEQAYFTCSCNIGMGAEIARGANAIRRYIGDFGGTAIASLRTIAKSKTIDLQIKHKNHWVSISDVNNFSVIINPFLASGLKLNLSKKPDDGKLVLFGIKNRNVFSLLKDLPKFYSGTITSAKNIFTADCQELQITSDINHEIEFDGDPRGFLPITIQIMPKKLQLIGGKDA